MFVSSAEPPALRALGESNGLAEQFGADFLWASHGLMYGVQRKEWRDLLASAQGDRLAKEVGQLQSCHVAILIVEGSPAWTTDGHIADRWLLRWTRPQYRRLLLSVHARGIWVLHTEDTDETISLLHDLQAWSQKGAHTSLARRPGPPAPWGTPGSRDWKLWVLQGFPMVGADRAKDILDHFGGELPLRWTVTEKDLMAIKGIGKKLARRLLETLASPEPEEAA